MVPAEREYPEAREHVEVVHAVGVVEVGALARWRRPCRSRWRAASAAVAGSGTGGAARTARPRAWRAHRARRMPGQPVHLVASPCPPPRTFGPSGGTVTDSREHNEVDAPSALSDIQRMVNNGLLSTYLPVLDRTAGDDMAELGATGKGEDAVEPPAVLARARALVVPALRAAVDRLQGEHMRRIAAYHFGWVDADGRRSRPAAAARRSGRRWPCCRRRRPAAPRRRASPQRSRSSWCTTSRCCTTTSWIATSSGGTARPRGWCSARVRRSSPATRC